VSARPTETRRRRVRLLKRLLSASCRGELDLESRFGTSVHAELKALFLANHIEADAGANRKWRLTASGRAEARRVLALKQRKAPRAA
jgi:hypothetical protein